MQVSKKQRTASSVKTENYDGEGVSGETCKVCGRCVGPGPIDLRAAPRVPHPTLVGSPVLLVSPLSSWSTTWPSRSLCVFRFPPWREESLLCPRFKCLGRKLIGTMCSSVPASCGQGRALYNLSKCGSSSEGDCSTGPPKASPWSPLRAGEGFCE